MSSISQSYNKSLFEPIEIKDLKFQNRIFMAPLTRNRADHDDNTVGGLNALYYSQRASGGLLISEAAQISQEAQGYAWTPGIYTEDHVAGWKIVTDAVHNAGGRIFCQLWHVGAISHPVFQKDEGLPVSSSPFKPEGKAFVGDKHPDGPQVDTVESRALETSEIPRLLSDFKKAAEMAKKAGFDGVEIHCANGYLMDQFIRDSVNKRSDKYGGSTENRIRIIGELVDSILEVWPAHRVGVRLSPVGGLGGSSDSHPKETYTKVTELIAGKGLLYLHVVRPNSHTAKGEENDETLITAMRKAFDGLFLINGEFTPEEADRWVEQGKADAVSFGRMFIANPDLPKRISQGGPYTEADSDTFYGGGAEGYVDYSPLDANPAPRVEL